MNMNDLHRRLLRDVLEVGNDLPFALTGGYAVQAHGIVDRLSRDIDVATNSSIPMEILGSRLIEGLTERGWKVHVIGIEPLSARFMVTDPELGQDCELEEGLAERLSSAQWRADEEFAAYGLPAPRRDVLARGRRRSCCPWHRLPCGRCGSCPAGPVRPRDLPGGAGRGPGPRDEQRPGLREPPTGTRGGWKRRSWPHLHVRPHVSAHESVCVPAWGSTRRRSGRP